MKLLQLLKRGWLKFAEALGWVNTRILLTLTYIVLIAPAAIAVRLMRKDLLKRRRPAGDSYWIPKEKTEHSLENAGHQF